MTLESVSTLIASPGWTPIRDCGERGHPEKPTAEGNREEDVGTPSLKWAEE